MSAAVAVTDAVYPGSGAATNAATRLAQYNALPLSGGTIWCAAGDYAAWTVPPRLFTGPVTIRSVDPANPAVFLGASFSAKSANVIFRDIVSEFRPTPSSAAFSSLSTIYGASEKITYLDCEFRGGLNQNTALPLYRGYNVGRMLLIGGGAKDVAALGCTFHTMSVGVLCLNNFSDRVTIEDCVTHSNSGDGFQMWSVAGLRFKRNVLRDALANQVDADADHVDGLQFANSAAAGTTRGMSDCWISDNIIHSGGASNSWFQSLFMSAEETAPAALRHRNVTVRNNLCYNAHKWGLLLRSCDGALIENNTVVRNWAQTNTAPGIQIWVSSCTGVTVRKNVAQAIYSDGGTTLEDNYVYTPASSGSQAEFVGGLAAGSSMAQLQPVPGGAILAGGYGATYPTAFPGETRGGADLDFSLDALPFNRFVYNSLDNTTATVTLKGKGTTGQSVQIRGESPGGNTAWSTGAIVDGAGNWTATLSVPRAQWGEWYTPAARAGTNDATKLTGANTFGCGFVVGLMGQSEITHVLDNGSFNNQSGMPAPASVAGERIVFTLLKTGNFANVQTLPFSTVSYVSDVTISKASMHMANLLMRVCPDARIHIVDLAVAGTGRTDLASDLDANTDITNARSWANFEATVNRAIGGDRQLGTNLTEMGHIVEEWFTNDLGQFLTPNAFFPLYSGRTSSGATFTLGGNDPVTGSRVDHCLWDLTGADRGLFSTNTKWNLAGIQNWADYADGVMPNSVTNGAGADNYQSRKRTIWTNLTATFNNAVFDGIRGVIGPDSHIYQSGYETSPGVWANQIHPSVDSEWGSPAFARHLGMTILQAIGYTVGRPEITGITPANDGSYADITVKLNHADGTLSTTRLERGLTRPAFSAPYGNQVAGIEIKRAGQTDRNQQGPFGFTASIADAGSGALPSRIGKVRITPAVPFANGDMISHLQGGRTGIYNYVADNAKLAFLDLLIEHVPAFDAGGSYAYDGIPVSGSVKDFALSGIGGGGGASAFTPKWWRANGQVVNSAPGSSFTAVADSGIKKQTLISTWKPGPAAASDNQCWFYSYGGIQLHTDGRFLRVQNPVNYRGALLFDMRSISGWTEHDYACVIALDTTQAVVANRAQGRLIDLTTGVTHVMASAGVEAFATQNADLGSFANGINQCYGAQKIDFAQQFDGEMERVQSWVNVCPDLGNLSGLYAAGALKNPADAGLIAAAGGGTLSGGQLVVDVHGDNIPTGVNPGAGPDYVKSGTGGWVAR